MMPETATNVFIVDDDEPVRSGMQELLLSVGRRARGFASAEEFLKAYEPTWHGCLLLDVRMPGMGGLKLQEELIRRDSDLTIVFLTGYGDLRMAAGAFKKGAADFLAKPIGGQELLDLVHEVLQKDAIAHEQKDAVRQVKRRLGTLTPRERTVLEGVKVGKNPKAIARELHISRKTVDWHMRSLREQLGVSSNEQLLLLLYRCNLLEETAPYPQPF